MSEPDTQAAPTPQAEFYVATDGNDAWSGKLAAPTADGTDGPFATLHRARNALRELGKRDEWISHFGHAADSFGGPVTVMVRGGTYYLSEPLLLCAQDSGTEQAPITYRAYPGEKVVLSGGRRLTGWEPYQGRIVQITLPEVREGRWWFRQLFFNGERQVRARYPHCDPDNPRYGGWLFVEESLDPRRFRYEAGALPRSWAKPRQVEINVFPWMCWNNDLIPVEAVDRESRTLTLSRPVLHRLNQAAGVHDFMHLMPGNRFCVENALEELDQPGEWCLDSETGTLYFWPPEGEVEEAEVVAPYLSRLVELRGSTGMPVRHLTLRGFTFAHTLAQFPQPQILPHNYPNAGGQAVYLEGAEYCTVQDCTFAAVGGDAIRLQNYNAHNRLLDNEIAYPGAQGICLAGVEQELPADINWQHREMIARLAAERPRAVRNEIRRNHIHHAGSLDKRGSGLYVFGLNCVDNVVANNLIHHTASRGMMIEHGFGRNFIEYNELHDLALETCDVGGINILLWYVVEDDEELCHGHVIRHNLVRNVVGCGAYETPAPGQRVNEGRIWAPYYSMGIYLDWNMTGTHVYGNLVVGNTLGGFMVGGAGHGRDNLIENNLFLDSSESQVYYSASSEQAASNRFVRNIVCYRDPHALLFRVHGNRPRWVAVSDYNLYWPPSGAPALDVEGVAAEESFAAWQAEGYDTHSVVADPLFVDPEGGDWRLRPESPAFALGFRPLEISRMGLRPAEQDA